MLTYLEAMVLAVRGRFERLREEPEAGFSSLEWAILAAAVIIIAAIVIVAVTNAVTNRSGQIS